MSGRQRRDVLHEMPEFAPAKGRAAGSGPPTASSRRAASGDPASPSAATTTGPAPFRLPDPDMEAGLAKRLGIAFHEPRLLRQALTHRSVLADWSNLDAVDATLQSNERLEFLGDAVLGALVAEHLYLRDPDAEEGALTRRRVAIVRAETLVRWARQLGMQHCLYLGTGERVGEGARDRMLAGAFEALVGAIHLDQGRAAAESFVLDFLSQDIETILEDGEHANPKGRLQEVLQDTPGQTPEYVTLAAEGPDHAREFTVAVMLRDERLGIGRGRSKREAQEAAARQALTTLGTTVSRAPVPAPDDAEDMGHEPAASARRHRRPHRKGSVTVPEHRDARRWRKSDEREDEPAGD